MSLITLLATLCLIVYLISRAIKPSRLPPAPSGVPLLGNFFQIPSSLLFLKLDEWRSELGDIYSLNLAGQNIIVLNSVKVGGDVLDRLSAVTSGRPRFVMAAEIMMGGFIYGLMQYGERWRRYRRITHEGFNIRASELYYPFQESEAMNLVKRLLVDHSDIQKEIRHAAASATWRSLYSGPSLSTQDNKRVEKMDYILECILKATMPMAYIVDIFPAIKYLPVWLAKWKESGINFFHDTDGYFMELYDEGRQQKSDGQEHAGFIASSAEAREKFGLTHQEAAWTAGGLLGAGVETTSVTLQYFVLAMVIFPEVARKAQEQIDRVVGDRTPTFADRENLPYVEACMKEVLRWRPAVPLGIIHVATEEFTYNDYVIPKGSLLLDNIWSMCHDPALFPDHEAFRPERFLDQSGNIREAAVDLHDDMLAYGHGRRICPGRHFANNTLFIDMAYLLWAFNFSKAKDSNGQNITPPTNAFRDNGLTIHPAPFDFELTARLSQQKLATIHDELEE